MYASRRFQGLGRFAFGWGGLAPCPQRARDVGPVDPFGFPWPLAVSLRRSLLMSVAFPWISSSESRLFNGLRGIKRGNFLLAASP
jgi:hypothetical protein